MAASEPASGGVSVRGLSVLLGKKRKVHVLDDVSFEVTPGTFCCLLGVSGCGKSTLLNVLAGFVQPTRGEVRLGGSLPGRLNRSAVVFQEYALFPWMTAAANVALGLESRGIVENARQRAIEYLAMVNLAEFADAHPHELSGGMQQRVAIARALACEPEFLLMDEPLGALDALTREHLKALIARLWAQFNQTVVYVTHDVGEAVYLADRVVLFSPRPGRVKEIVEVTLQRPRRVSDPAFVAMVASLMEVVIGQS